MYVCLIRDGYQTLALYVILQAVGTCSQRATGAEHMIDITDVFCTCCPLATSSHGLKDHVWCQRLITMPLWRTGKVMKELTLWLTNVLTGYGKTITHVIIGLKTAKGTKQLKLDPSIYESLQKEKVEPGDVIYIEANSGAVKVRIWLCQLGVMCFYYRRRRSVFVLSVCLCIRTW